MVKTPSGIKTLLKIGGPERVKEIICQDNCEFDIKNPIHTFLVSMFCRKFVFNDNIDKIFGITGVDKHNDITKKVKLRRYRREVNDPLNLSNSDRRIRRRILFDKKSTKLIKEECGYIYFKKRLGPASVIYKTRRGFQTRKVKCFINNGKLEVRDV